jgi:hypothetical protein
MAFVMKPQEGMGKPFVPLSRGRDGLLSDLVGTMLNVAPVSTKYLSYSSSFCQSGISGQICEGNAWWWQWHVLLLRAPSCKELGAAFSEKVQGSTHILPLPHKNCGIYTCYCQGFEFVKS